MLRTYHRSERRTTRFDVSSMCRMCLTQNLSADKLVEIFVEEPVTNVSVIKYCIGIECEEKDGLPPKICYDCYSCLTTFFTFKTMCLASDKYCKAFILDAATITNEPPVNMENVEPKDEPTDEPTDELSLAENNDMGLLETDSIHPGAPDEVLSRIKKCEEDYQLAHPNENFMRDSGTVVPIPNWEVEVEEEEEEEEEFLPQFQQEHIQGVGSDVLPDREPQQAVGDGQMISRDVSVLDSPQPTRSFLIETSPPTRSVEPTQQMIENSLQATPAKQSQSFKRVPVATSESPFIFKLEGKKHYCDLCSKPFLSQNSLKRHIKNHGTAEYKCPQCGKEFHQGGSMKRHLLLHSDRRFVCSTCSKVLLSREGLKCHIRTQHTERTGRDYYKYKCRQCSKTFAHSSGLSRHMAIHRGISYECDSCLKKFNDSSQLKRHKSKNHLDADSDGSKDVSSAGSLRQQSNEPTATTVS